MWAVALLSVSLSGQSAAAQTPGRPEPRVLGEAITPEWSEDGETMLYRWPDDTGRPVSHEVVLVSGEKNTVAADAAPRPVKPAGRVRPSRDRGGEIKLEFENRLERPLRLHWVDRGGARQHYATLAPGEVHQQHTFTGHSWLLTDDAGVVVAAFLAPASDARAVVDANVRAPRDGPRDASAADSTEPRVPGVLHAASGAVAFVRDHDLWLRHADGEEVRWTVDGSPAYRFDENARALHWSPDGRFLLALHRKVVETREVTVVESSPEDQVQPKVHSFAYRKPGDPLPQAVPRLFDAVAGRELPIDRKLFEDPWSIGRVRWSADGRRVQMLYNRRGHQLLRVVAVDLTADGDELAEARTRVLVEERSPTFIDYSQKTFLQVLDGGELLWTSEREGWNHLYVVPADGGAPRQLTHGEWNVRAVEQVEADAVLFWAVGRVDGQDSYYRQLCRVPLDDGELVQLTAGDGDHAVQWSPDRSVFVDTWSRVDLPPVHALRSAKDGREIAVLGEAWVEDLDASGRRLPERFTAPGRDGATPIHGIIHYPRDFDPASSYPVIENIYAGPHGAHTPKGFRARYRTEQEFTDAGFVVVQCDGMGTNWRGKNFHDVAWKNLKDAGFPDRIEWIRAAAAKRPWMDLSRVGIFGGSAGGQNAMRAVLDHADFYRAAAADCGCHDNRMDKIWWNEAWMGVPGDGSYVASSNTEDAHKLGGALLLTVGELDRNVDPASTYQVVNALRRAGKDFDFMLFPGMGHGAGGSDYGRAVRLRFFQRELGAK